MTNYLVAVLLLLSGAAVSADQAASASTARYTQAASGSVLAFTFTQLGAPTEGRFKQFATELLYDENSLAASSLKVTVQIGSLDTQDQERDGVLLTPDLFDAQKHPTASFVASSLVRAAGGIEAVGKLTIRGVSKDLRLPLSIKPTPAGLELAGQTFIKRLAFGVGQGEWQATDSVGDEVKINFKVALARAR